MRRFAGLLALTFCIAPCAALKAENPPWSDCDPTPPCARPSPIPPYANLPGMTPAIPENNTNQGQQSPSTDAFAQAPPAGAEAAAMALPNLIGDQNTFMLSSNRSSTRNSRAVNARNGANAALAQVGRGAFKITENESPAPQDRVFVTYNYFYNVYKTFNPAGVDVERTNISREEIGFEKTFLGGDASFGMRLPIFEATGQFFDKSDVGDLSMIFKYAFYNDRETGNLLSAGMVLTVPTGPAFTIDGTPDIHSTLFQPFLGSIWRSGDFYLHGFTSILVPTDSRDVTFVFNDYGIGYFVYKNFGSDYLNFISPTVEAHVNTPLNHRGSQDYPLGGIDVFDMTYGVTLGFAHHATLTIGINTPLSGPKPYDVEAVAELNWNF